MGEAAKLSEGRMQVQSEQGAAHRIFVKSNSRNTHQFFDKYSKMSGYVGLLLSLCFRPHICARFALCLGVGHDGASSEKPKIGFFRSGYPGE